jgi:hypothetical protein
VIFRIVAKRGRRLPEGSAKGDVDPKFLEDVLALRNFAVSNRSHESRVWIQLLKQAPLHRDGSIRHEQLRPIVVQVTHEC